MVKNTAKILGQCQCGRLRFETSGAPILCVACHCAGCQKAALGFAQLPGAPQVLNGEGGTEFTLFRKDRLTWLSGESLLRAYRLTPEADTRRVLATCCDAPIFLEFKGGHWLSVYRARLDEAAPPVEMRVMTRGRLDTTPFSNELPSYSTHSFRFMWCLFGAWVAMGFRVPKLAPIAEAP